MLAGAATIWYSVSSAAYDGVQQPPVTAVAKLTAYDADASSETVQGGNSRCHRGNGGVVRVGQHVDAEPTSFERHGYSSPRRLVASPWGGVGKARDGVVQQ